MNKLFWWNAEARMLQAADRCDTMGFHKIAEQARASASLYRQNAEKAA